MLTFSVFFYSNSLCQYSNAYTKLPQCGKFETFYDIPFCTYYQMLEESENRIMTDLTTIHKRKQEKANAKQAKEKPFTLKNLLNVFRKKYGNETKIKTEGTLTESTETLASAPNRKVMKKYLHFFSLPAELRNKIVSEMEINDFGKLADIAESEKSQSVAIFARGWITTRCVIEKHQNDSI